MTQYNHLLDPTVLEVLQQHRLDFEALQCDPKLADTADFCKHYGFTPDMSANALLVGSKKGEPKFALCVVLANCRLDVNKAVRKKLEVKRLSFADPDTTKAMTGMELGGVTPIGVPTELPVWIDAAVMQLPKIILGGGNRQSKLLLPPDELLKLQNTETVAALAIPN
ncbi:MAG: hypothetical protein KTR35_02055 [Gammaproteobacteria bacterium]|nr:hypothetical protein [Gammaproteobacteria bacterium]